MITATPSPPMHHSGSFIHSHGTKVFVRPRLDGVQDAVAQARFNEKKWVWIQDPQSGYRPAQVIHENQEQIEVELDNGQVQQCGKLDRPVALTMAFGQRKLVDTNQVFAMNPPKFDMVQDMAELTHLNEPSVLHNLTVRYRANAIYRGESGAGKTENTKIAIQYLASVASENSGRSKDVNQLERQILQANPILESFGNAQTIRNNNSSRFGKFIRIEFNMRAQICGANIEWYLLEKSRVHQQASHERNYHIFYQLLNAPEQFKEPLLLAKGQPSDYEFTRHANAVIEGVDDAEEFNKLMDAMHVMRISEKEMVDYFRIVAAVLHLGNITLTSDRGERADVRDFSAIERVCHLLGIPAQEFTKSLLSPRIKAGRDWVSQAKSPQQVRANLDALAKTLYERNFGSLVDRVNRAIDGQKTTDKMGFIGVLDIAGFEIFEINSFEQLCINYTNEKLQQFFNHNMFVLEQEEYKRENIEWSFINFGLDLQPTIDLIEKTNPMGILSCLEEECVAPRGTDQRFLEKLNRVWDHDNANKYKSMRFRDGFVINHYAGQVEYSTVGWIEKNKDPLNEDITRLLARSNQRHVALLFEDYLSDEDDEHADARRSEKRDVRTLLKLRKGGGSFRTVGQRHKQQLLSLMKTLYSTHPHFVRCILPNNRKRPGEMQNALVLDQLRCNGVLEGIRICRKGYPNRLPFADFRKRYEILCPNELDPTSFIDGRTACQILLNAMQLDPAKYRIGTTKLFFKASVLADLEEIRDRKLAKYITGFQAACRRYLARHHMSRYARQTEAIKKIQRNARIYVTLCEWPWWKVYAKLKPLNVAYRVETQIKERDQKIQTLQGSLHALQDQLTGIKALNEELESQHSEYKEFLRNEQAMVRELQESKECLLEKLNTSEERMEELVAELDQARTESRALEMKLKIEVVHDLRKQLREHDDENVVLGAQCESLQKDNKLLMQQRDVLTKDKKQFEDQLKQAKKENERTIKAHDAAKKQEAEVLEQLELVVADNLHLKSTCSSLQATVEQTKSRVSQLVTNVEKLETQQQELQQTLQQKIQEMQQMEVSLQIDQQSQVMQEWETKYNDLQSQYEKLQQSLADERAQNQEKDRQMEKYVSEFQEIIQKASEDYQARTSKMGHILSQMLCKQPAL
ncbi:P-loop containing nucleoside triphosphate hydrolase protein [Radiomyces spectabilis]|uniref:P-loop containing nucleoside triphosphate hydrolase protein n=1 Tax=Radiomyces spectabilis TaxID=64574 RepID=UPI00222086C7|nr:P-loop containing nucleoside triphosphate hydrolase protein [Radiomyces spectabilis]KAI8372758.1 P-loop containing nucleoside triphosphate hydrolase protein [Radiomyces spectabilis]